MQRVKAEDTTPERLLRGLIQNLGFRGYRLHRADLPGKPDIAWIGQRRAMFVHGCFWHGHSCRRGDRIPETQRHYWVEKIRRNSDRDSKHLKNLKAAGWRVLILWECELRNEKRLAKKILRFLLP